MAGVEEADARRGTAGAVKGGNDDLMHLDR